MPNSRIYLMPLWHFSWLAHVRCDHFFKGGRVCQFRDDLVEVPVWVLLTSVLAIHWFVASH